MSQTIFGTTDISIQDEWARGGPTFQISFGVNFDPEAFRSFPGEGSTLFWDENHGWMIGTRKKGDQWKVRFVRDRKAREFLRDNGHTDALATMFSKPGRPSIGDRVDTRLPAEDIARIDALAKEKKISRAEMIRQLLTKALADQDGPAVFP